VRRRHDRDEILAAAVDVAHTDGLNQLSFGRVAKRLDIADRTVVYYFATKHDLITAVLIELGAGLQVLLADAVTGRADDHQQLVTMLWPTLSHADHAATTRTYLEAIGLAAAGTDPYTALVPALIDEWLRWTAERIDHADPNEQAAAAVAIIDGLLVLQHVAPDGTAELAIRHLSP